MLSPPPLSPPFTYNRYNIHTVLALVKVEMASLNLQDTSLSLQTLHPVNYLPLVLIYLVLLVDGLLGLRYPVSIFGRYKKFIQTERL